MPEERRIVTVLFADVTGSTAPGEALGAEDVRALLSRYYAIAKDVVVEHGGTLEKFIGDAVMAVFGLPSAHGDDPQRALSAAIELRDRVRAEPRLGAQLSIRLGVNTGEVVATRDSSGGDFLVTGDTVNVAARLQQTAEPWMMQARRALGLMDGDRQQLERCLVLLDRAGAVPGAARVHCELALMSGNESQLAEGLHQLESLGDVDQMSRYEHVRVR